MGIALRTLVIVCATILAQISASLQHASAQTKSGLMTFQLVRNTDQNCGTLCPEWIYASGKIRHKTVGEFRRFVNRLNNNKLPIIFNSAGGDIDAAIEIGREIRRRNLNTGIGLTKFDCDENCNKKSAYLIGRVTNEPGDCNTACLYAFSGGVSRYNEAGNYVIAVDSVRLEGFTSKKAANRFLAKVQAKTRSYLSDMGVSPDLVSLMKKSDEPYDIPFKEQQSLNLVTVSGVRALLNANVCSQPIPSGHCVERK